MGRFGAVTRKTGAAPTSTYGQTGDPIRGHQRRRWKAAVSTPRTSCFDATRETGKAGVAGAWRGDSWCRHGLRGDSAPLEGIPPLRRGFRPPRGDFATLEGISSLMRGFHPPEGILPLSRGFRPS